MQAVFRWFFAMGIFLAVVLGIVAPQVTEAQQQKNIIILNSYHKEFTWADNQSDGMIQSLRNLGADPIFHVEYMDWKYSPTQENLRLRYEQYKLRYANRKIDLIMTTDDAALQFALKHRQELFSNAPIIFTGVMKASAHKLIAGQTNVTGVCEKFDAEGTIRLMYKLNPSLQRIYLAYDNTESGLQTMSFMAEAAYKVNPNVELLHLNTYTFSDIMKKLSMIPANDNSAVLINTYSRDVEGTTMEMERFVKLFSESSTVPSYILYDFDSGYGAVGGSLIGGRGQGEAAAKVALAILKGENASSIPFVEATKPEVVLDYKQLEKYHIPLGNIPPEATVINRPQSFYEQYKTAVWTAICIFAMMMGFIVLLMANISKRRLLEGELRKSNIELSALYEEMLASQEELQYQYQELSVTQEALRESEGQYRSLINNVNVGVYRNTADIRGRFIQVNPAMANIFGYDSVEEFLEVAVIDLYQDTEDRVEFLEQVTKNGLVKDREIAMRKKDGTPIWCSCTSNVQYDEKGAIKWIDSVLEDVTERKRVNEALRQAHNELEAKVEQRTEELASTNQELTEAIENLKTMQAQLIQSEKMAALGSLVAGVAHEINTPVGVGVTAASHLKQITEEFLKLCKTGAPLRKDLTNYLETLQEASTIILRNLERAGTLIHSFKQVSIDQSNETQRIFKVKNYLEEILISMNPKIKRTKQQVTVDCDDEIAINGFPGAFAQIITNLIVNSLTHAYAPEDVGQIKIEVREKGENILVTYSDDGKGMERNVRERIFDPFFTTKRGTGGTGLGLYIVYNIITQQYGGTIECISAPGEGTTMKIKMPIVKAGNKKIQTST